MSEHAHIDPSNKKIAMLIAVLALVLHLFGARFAVSHYPKETAFIVGQTAAAFTAMSFNFVLNNELTYSDKRLRGFFPILRGWLKFFLTCSFGMLANIGVSTALVRVGVHSADHTPVAPLLVVVVAAGLVAAERQRRCGQRPSLAEHCCWRWQRRWCCRRPVR